MGERFYLLHVRLRDIEPQIWRRFVVPSRISLDRLHDVVQIVMGWTDSHLHEFTIGKERYTENPQSREEGLEASRLRLDVLVKRKGRKFGYLYDFGDNWEHELVLEDSRYNDPGQRFPLVCLEGARACPPEDVGGVSGYQEFCRIMSDPDHEEYSHNRGWLGKEYDSEGFLLGVVNDELLKYLRWSRERTLPW